MKPSPEELENLIHHTLTSLPPRRAPHTLEERVLTAIAMRRALPWYRQSFAHWPMVARILLLVACAGIAKLLLLLGLWTLAGFETAPLAPVVARELAWLAQLRAVGASFLNLGELFFRTVPATWLYAALAVLAGCYAALVGVGAAAYRTFALQR